MSKSFWKHRKVFQSRLLFLVPSSITFGHQFFSQKESTFFFYKNVKIRGGKRHKINKGSNGREVSILTLMCNLELMIWGGEFRLQSWCMTPLLIKEQAPRLSFRIVLFPPILSSKWLICDLAKGISIWSGILGPLPIHSILSSKRLIYHSFKVVDLWFIQRYFNMIRHSRPTPNPLNSVLEKVDRRPAIPITVHQQGAGWMSLTIIMRTYF